MSPDADPRTARADGLFQLTLGDHTSSRGERGAAVDWEGLIDALFAEAPTLAPWIDLEGARLPAAALQPVPQRPTLVLGLGGSALGTRAAVETARRAGELRHELRVLDTVDPTTVRDHLEWAAAKQAAVHVVSKSGRTDEVRALLDVVMSRGLGPHVLISDPGQRPFDALLNDAGRSVVRLEIPPAVGGRFSVFTAVGQAPLHATGLDLDALFEGARAARDSWRSPGGAGRRALISILEHRTRHLASAHVVWCYSDGLLPWAAWLQQLECESLGRATDGGGVGELVTVLRGPADQHSVAQLLLDGPRDQRVTIVDYADPGVDASREPDLNALATLRAVERDATFEAMRVPAQRLLLEGRALGHLGGLMMYGLAWTVLTAHQQGLDPYGQPAVEDIKRRVKAKLAGGDA